jgi:hypothetical protein
MQDGDIAQDARWKPYEVQDELAAHDQDKPVKPVSEKKQA